MISDILKRMVTGEFQFAEDYMEVSSPILENPWTLKRPLRKLTRKSKRNRDLLVSWCFEPSQPHRITSGLKRGKEGERLT